jgi:hypothetical protein
MKNFKSGTYINQGSYKSFQPELISGKWVLDNMEVLSLLSQADRQLGRLDMYSEYIPNIDLFISMHVLKEATQSSKIEGTKTNIEEALLNREDVSEEKRDDWEEIQNYIAALNKAIEKLNEIPFSSRLIRQTHEILLSGVRGKRKLPGEFRSSQNWIGGASISDATFIPPIHTTINEYMGDLEKFAHDNEHYFPELLKIAAESQGKQNTKEQFIQTFYDQFIEKGYSPTLARQYAYISAEKALAKVKGSAEGLFGDAETGGATGQKSVDAYDYNAMK